MQLVSARSWIALLLALVLLAAPTFAEGEAASDIHDWSPPEASDAMDRIVLKSGETLYGDFEGMRDRKVYFDSDEFDNVDFNWSKVASVHLTESHIFRLRNRNVMGTAEMREGVIRVRTSSGEIIEFERGKLISITQGGEQEASFWSGDIGVDLSASDGNTEQIDFSGHVNFKRETGLTRWISDYRGIYSEVDGDKNAENHRANSALDIFVTSRLFVTAPVVEFFRDEFQNIRTRISPGLAIGYEFIKSDQVEWDASIGGSYVYTDFFEGADAEDDFAAVVNTVLEIDFTSDIELDSQYRVQIVATDFDKTNHHFETVLSHDVWGPVELDVTFILDRIEAPVADDDGDTPKPNDFRLMVGLSVDF